MLPQILTNCSDNGEQRSQEDLANRDMTDMHSI